MQEEYYLLDHCCPPSSLSNSPSDFFARLPLLSRNDLLNCARRFRETIPTGCRAKAGYIKLIEDDFVRQTQQLVLWSTPDLLQRVSVPASDCTPRLSLICQLIHNRYGSIVASQLLCSPARWNPSPVMEEGTPQPGWFQTPITQLRSRLSKAGTETIRECCDLYAIPDRAPKLKTERYDLIIERFRARALYLMSLSNVEFAMEHIALLPWTLPDPSLPRTQLLEVLLTEEFGEEISEQLISLPSSEITKERNKRARREKHAAVVADSHAAREAYAQSWPQVVPKDVVYECLDAYYKGTQWTISSTCCICSRRQHAVEMHNIILNTDEDLPDYLEILRDDPKSQFPADEFRFADQRLNGLVLDSDGIQVAQSQTTLRVCHPCHGYIPRSLMPRFALAKHQKRWHEVIEVI